VTYATFDPQSNDVLRLDFVPEFVTADGRPLKNLNNDKHTDLDQPGYTFDASTHVLHIRHDTAREIDVQGSSGAPPAQMITFDDPHLPAGTVLNGEYPAGAVEWDSDQWKIGVPHGGFGTFNLTLNDRKSESAGFRFYWPRHFVGLDVYNDGAQEATVIMRCPEMREVTFTIKPGELRRLRTGWPDPSSRVDFTFKNGEGLIFDNLAYRLD